VIVCHRWVLNYLNAFLLDIFTKQVALPETLRLHGARCWQESTNETSIGVGNRLEVFG